MHRALIDTMRRIPLPVWLTYLVTLTGYLLASQVPELRLWGVSHFSYLPSIVQWFLVPGLLIAPLLLCSRKPEPEHPTLGTDHFQGVRPWLISSSLITTLFGAVFYFLRARTFFLGDGYTCLSQMARETPLIKYREVGESLVHAWVKGLADGNPEQAALTAYQLVSIGSGVLFVIVILVGAGFLFNRHQERWLFSLGMLSGGYMLLFFGYVENYSLFVLSVAVFVILGLLAARGLLNGWWLILLVAIASFFHVLGATLLPAAVFLWSHTTATGQRFRRLRPRRRYSIHASILLVSAAVFYYFYTSAFIVRFVLLPIGENRFTVEGYTASSFDHLIDYGNLILLLCPGILVVAASAGFCQIRSSLQLPAYRFLAISIATTMGAMFFIDPKLGLPRDWDLFSFCGVPLVAAVCFFLIDRRDQMRSLWKPAILVTLLGIVSLGVRAANFAQPFTGAQIAVDYSKLDVRRGMAWRRVLQDFYTEHHDFIRADAEYERYFADFPEYHLNETGLELLQAGRIAEAETFFQRSLAINPQYVAALYNLGLCCLQTEQFSEAVDTLEMAARLGPDKSEVFSKLGQAYFKIDAHAEAEKAWKRSLHLLPGRPEPLIGLLNLYKRTQQEELFYKYLIEVAAMDNTPVQYSLQVAEYHLKAGETTKAVDALKHATTKGLDSTHLDSIIAKYPALLNHF